VEIVAACEHSVGRVSTPAHRPPGRCWPTWRSACGSGEPPHSFGCGYAAR